MEADMPIRGARYPFNEKNVNASPKQHGVYAFFDGDELIYYGRAAGDNVTIRSRLRSHLLGHEGKCTQNAKTYRREVTETPKTREVELLEEFKRQYHRLPRCNEPID
jgi:hypothetical protein